MAIGRLQNAETRSVGLGCFCGTGRYGCDTGVSSGRSEGSGITLMMSPPRPTHFSRARMGMGEGPEHHPEPHERCVAHLPRALLRLVSPLGEQAQERDQLQRTVR